MLKRRHEIIAAYNEALRAFDIKVLNHEDKDHRSSGHLYFIRVGNADESVRNQLIEKFAAKGIATNVHYKPLPMLTAYKNMGFDIKDYPNAYEMYKNEITLPLYSMLSDEQVAYVVDSFKEVLKEYKV